METLIGYFETIPSSHRSLLLVSGITIFWLLEGAVPLVRFKYRKWRHALPNIFFTLTTVAVNFALAFLLLQASDWTQTSGFDIFTLGWSDNPELSFLRSLALSFRSL